MKPIVIIPAYNPDNKLIRLVEELEMLGEHVLIVDDGSSKKCRSVFEELENRYKCEIKHHGINKGKGAALKTGIRYAAEHYPDCIGYITADADGQHTPEDIIKISETLQNDMYSFVLGTRNFNDKGIPFKSRWGNKITSIVFFLTTGKKCLDTQTGLRGIPSRLFMACLSIPGNRYEYEMNMLMNFAYKGNTFVSVPIETIYLENNKSSHFHPLKDSVRIYMNIFRYSFTLRHKTEY